MAHHAGYGRAARHGHCRLPRRGRGLHGGFNAPSSSSYSTGKKQ